MIARDLNFSDEELPYNYNKMLLGGSHAGSPSNSPTSRRPTRRLKKFIESIQSDRLQAFPAPIKEIAQKVPLIKQAVSQDEDFQQPLVSVTALKRLHNMYNIQPTKAQYFLQKKGHVNESLTHRTITNESQEHLSTNKKSMVSEYFYPNHLFSYSKSKLHKIPALNPKTPIREGKSVLGLKLANEDTYLPSFREAPTRSHDQSSAQRAEPMAGSTLMDGSTPRESSTKRTPAWLNDSSLLKSKEKIVGMSKNFRFNPQNSSKQPLSNRSNGDFSEGNLLARVKEQDIFSTIRHLKELLKPNY